MKSHRASCLFLTQITSCLAKFSACEISKRHTVLRRVSKEPENHRNILYGDEILDQMLRKGGYVIMMELT